ncbi:hypothetical protein N7508_008816 [Penicillium antarcticum]|uniref:uncharacterized protein n=1 Tax=Penicillium antarcticum TaxID=416450 RepID=UPI00238E2BB4|nr:uncharacterized protein N7508_008816 [Penicillium antarcticum]KAJ5293995.1 hypothetical protein N7508_008816 [Penicillium antarcticum]
MSQPDNSRAIAEQFLQHYYTTFEGDRSALASLYRDLSKLTYEDETFEGAKIMTKIADMPAAKREFARFMSQYYDGDKGILIMLHGLLGDEGLRMNFIHTFNLRQDEAGFFVSNEMFQLVYNA